MGKIKCPFNARIKGYQPKDPVQSVSVGQLSKIMKDIDQDAFMVMVLYRQNENQFYFPDEAIFTLLSNERATVPELELRSGYYDQWTPLAFNWLKLNIQNNMDANGNVNLPIKRDGMFINRSITNDSPVILDTHAMGRCHVNDVVEFTEDGNKFVGFVVYC